MNPSASIFLGPAGWSYSDWEGTVYPAPVPRGFNRLGHIAGRFDFVEVNMTFYAIPSLRIVQGWMDKTREKPDFCFWIKALQDFTHKRELNPHTLAAFRRNCLDPLQKQGRLAGILFQFPYSFKRTPGNLSYIESLINLFCSYCPAFEFRHRCWQHPDALNLLRNSNCVWVNIDQPVISQSLPLTSLQTCSQAVYYRLHGRNHRNWFSNKGRNARYDYNYSLKELQRLAQSMQKVSPRKRLYVSGNNHYKGQAVQNLLALRRILEEEAGRIPR